MTTLADADPHELAQAWLAVDPDAATRAETAALVAEPSPLGERFGGHLEFGTAGMRGALGTGPHRMNRVMVRLVASALAARLADAADPHLVIGYDARHGSRDFANDTARIAAGAGMACTLLPRPLPTPILAFAVKRLGATAGVMVTASHNPRTDNGYKIYWSDGSQIIEPVDAEISDLLGRVELEDTVDLPPLDHERIATADEELIEAYLDAIVGLLGPTSPRTARVVYTPLHGVGAEVVGRAFARARFEPPLVVPTQAEPDPDFPTAPTPNAEEPGVLGPLLELAAAEGADVALANDPDADRLSVAVPSGGGWRLLTGDEVGCLLAHHLLDRRPADAGPALVTTTVVSSRLLASIANDHGAVHVETPTGFKWLARAGAGRTGVDYVLGYEEALGYAAGDVVGDKDGISAALLVAELVGTLAEEGRSLLDLLDELHRRHGVHLTGQRSIRFEEVPEAEDDASLQTEAMTALRVRPPTTLGGHPVVRFTDLAPGTAALPPTDALVIELDGARVVIRPSGTEPKMKVYGEVMRPPTDETGPSRLAATSALGAILADAVAVASRPEGRSTAGRTGGSADREAEAAALMADVPEGRARADLLRLIVGCIDLTTLSGDDTRGRIRALCATARRPDPTDPTVGPVAAVCLYPSLVGLARELTEGSPVKVASVAGAFPSALSPLPVRLADIRAAIEAGADEIDTVLDRSAFLDGRFDLVSNELRAAREAAGEAKLKVIIEVGELGSASAIRRATELAIEAGADTVKTSTGKIATGATPEAVLAMATCIDEHRRATGATIGIKVAGGVRTAETALGYAALVGAVVGEEWWQPDLLRFGASGLLTDLVDQLTATELALAHPEAGRV